MSSSTARFRFELHLFDWVERQVCRWNGERSGCFIAFRDDGSLRRIYFASPFQPWDADQRARMVAAHERWMLYLPGACSGQGYLEWSDLPEARVVASLGTPLDGVWLRALDGGPPLRQWPSSWKVCL